MPSTSATSFLLEHLKSRLASENLPFPWAVGYSGGRDSAVLLWALVQAAGPGRVVALYVDHGWRNAEERALEAGTVAAWCSRLGVTLTSFGPPDPVTATEAAARDHRYACFQTFIDRHPGSPVFLAHHADDQAETILLRLLQGRSWMGLGGIPEKRGAYRRPLLGLRRSLLAEAAREQAVPFHEDSTNGGTGPRRNYLRRQVLPLVEDRFPGAVGALGDFGRLWTEVRPRTGLAPEWSLGDRGGEVPAAVWDRWPVLVRQVQLQAVASRCDPGIRLTRRFLEAVCAPDRTRPARGAGWAWRRKSGTVRWETVVQRAVKEYLVWAGASGTCDLGAYRLTWGPAGNGADPGRTGLFLGAVDPDRPWVWRSASPGMRFSSLDDPDWGRDKRRRRLGSLDPRRCAVVLQDGLVRAVADPQGNRLVWSETGGEKLHKAGIFVTLVWVM